MDVLVAMLRARGFEAVPTVEAGNLHKSDLEQLEYAAAQAVAIVTHNRVDFEALAIRWLTDGKSHGGVIISVRRPAYDVARRLLAILNDVTADEMQNQIRYI